jgi:hypothetical protein
MDTVGAGLAPRRRLTSSGASEIMDGRDKPDHDE